jgi:hypothetical protein
MSTQLVARSIARPVYVLLQPWAFSARVAASFTHVCDLITTAGEVIAVVDPQVGDGPLNVVVAAAEDPGEPGAQDVQEVLASLKPGMPVHLERTRMQVGDLDVDLSSAATWEPCPDWDFLRGRQSAVAGPLQRLREMALAQPPQESLLYLMQESVSGASELARAVQAAARAGAGLLRAGWAGDVACLREGVAWLAGLGGGLTPAGDDFLCGVMLAAWLAHPEPEGFCQVVVEIASPRTTALSAALLRAAGQGECSAAWHGLLAALLPVGAEPAGRDLAKALRGVLAHGATSGADALAGFVTGCTYTLPT